MIPLVGAPADGKLEGCCTTAVLEEPPAGCWGMNRAGGTYVLTGGAAAGAGGVYAAAGAGALAAFACLRAGRCVRRATCRLVLCATVT